MIYRLVYLDSVDNKIWYGPWYLLNSRYDHGVAYEHMDQVIGDENPRMLLWDAETGDAK